MCDGGGDVDGNDAGGAGDDGDHLDGGMVVVVVVVGVVGLTLAFLFMHPPTSLIGVERCCIARSLCPSAYVEGIP